MSGFFVRADSVYADHQNESGPPAGSRPLTAQESVMPEEDTQVLPFPPSLPRRGSPEYNRMMLLGMLELLGDPTLGEYVA